MFGEIFQAAPPQRQLQQGVRALLLAVSALAFLGSLENCLGRTAHAQEPPETKSRSFEKLAADARAAMESNRIPEAIQLYEQATSLRPSWSQGWWYLGTILFDSNQPRKARDAFERFVAVEHTQPGPGFGMLGLAEFQLREYPEALSALERGTGLGLGENADFVRAVLYKDGILNNFLGHPEMALIRLTRIANLTAAAHPESPREVVLADLELLDAFGLAALRIANLPDEIPPPKIAMVREAGHAQALVALQDRVAAGNEMRQLVSKYPSESGVHYMYGVHLLKEDPPSAIAEFRREIAVSPRNAAARIQLALQFLAVSEYKQGLKYAKDAVALTPGDFVAHIACGKLWLGLGDAASALRELRIAARLSPGSPDAHYALSLALTAAGQSSEAAQQRAEFVRLKKLSGQSEQ